MTGCNVNCHWSNSTKSMWCAFTSNNVRQFRYTSPIRWQIKDDNLWDATESCVFTFSFDICVGYFCYLLIQFGQCMECMILIHTENVVECQNMSQDNWLILVNEACLN